MIHLWLHLPTEVIFHGVLIAQEWQGSTNTETEVFAVSNDLKNIV